MKDLKVGDSYEIKSKDGTIQRWIVETIYDRKNMITNSTYHFVISVNQDDGRIKRMKSLQSFGGRNNG